MSVTVINTTFFIVFCRTVVLFFKFMQSPFAALKLWYSNNMTSCLDFCFTIWFDVMLCYVMLCYCGQHFRSENPFLFNSWIIILMTTVLYSPIFWSLFT